jgi:uncharacterized protein (DUF58 family)
MAEFGVSTERKPERPEELIDSALMARLDRVDVLSRKIFAGKLKGERRSKKRGISVEFEDYRQYSHGDDLRFVDWNVYARLDRLFLKLFLEEEDLALIIAIDASASMDWGNPNKFVFAQRLAMALGYVGLTNQNRVSVHAFSDAGLERLPNLRGRRRTHELGTWLINRTPRGAGNFDDAMRAIALGRQGKGVMVIISDFLLREGYEKGLRYVASRGFDTFCLQVLSPEELDPAAAGLTGDLRLTDLETEGTAEVTVNGPLLQQYRDTLRTWCDGLHDYCVRRDMMHMTIDTSTSLTVLLLEYFRQRGLLR